MPFGLKCKGLSWIIVILSLTMFTLALICWLRTVTQTEVTVACPHPRATALACGNVPPVNLCDFGFRAAVRTTEARLCLLFRGVHKKSSTVRKERSVHMSGHYLS